MRIVKATAALALLAFLCVGSAWANAGTKGLTAGKAPDNDRRCQVKQGSTCYYGIDATTDNSAVFSIRTKTATACLDPNIATEAGGTVTVSFRRVVGSGAVEGSFVPAAASTSTLGPTVPDDCFTMVAGSWWLELGGSQETEALVAITGQGKN